MENQSKPTNKIALNYGIYLGIASVVLAAIIYALGKTYEQDWKNMVVSIVIMAVITFLGIKKFKEFNDGNLTLGQALKTGLGIALIGAVISIIYTLIFTNFIEPDYMDKVMVVQREAALERFPDLSDEQLDGQMEMVKKFSSPIMTSAFALIGSLFFGFVISLIEGLILKNDPNK